MYTIAVASVLSLWPPERKRKKWTGVKRERKRES